MFKSLEEMRKRWFFGDVHVRDIIPSYAKAYWKRKDFNIQYTPEDEAILKEGTVDYIGFSYYMSTVVKTDQEEANKLGEFDSAIRN